MYDFEISNEELNELNNYTKYLKYIRKGSIKSAGNKNWLLIDSSNFKFKRLLSEIEKINTFNGFLNNVIYDYDFVTKRYGFDENRFLSSLKNYHHTVNIIIITTFSSSVALKKLGKYATFFINYDITPTKSLKQENIKKYIEENNFQIEDETLLDELANLSDVEIENTITRAFINSLNDHSTILKKEYFPNEIFKTNINELYDELDSLIGLNTVKNTLKEIINYLLISKKRNDMPVINMTFLGNPGTGKTTVAKLLGKILSKENILGKNMPFVEASRETLIGKFIGETEQKTMSAINNAVGGILFIDEAYSLVRDDFGRDFGKEVIDVLVNQMDIHKNDLCVIFAGYKSKMIDFLDSNPGLESRIPFKIEFNDYTSDEMLSIFNNFANKNFHFDENFQNTVKEHFTEAKKRKNFGNARYVRNFYERLKIKQANRILIDHSDMNYFISEDIKKTIESLQEIKKEEKAKIGF